MDYPMIDFIDEPKEIKRTMSSLEIAELTGKQHAHVMEAIRKMEPAWIGLGQSKFRLAKYKDIQGKERPYYELSKAESLFISTKFKDEARAKLVLRWIDLETGAAQPAYQMKPKSANEMFLMQAQINIEQERRINLIEQRLDKIEEEREENGRLLLETTVSANAVPVMTLRKSIIALVNEYSAASNTKQQDVYHKIYADLYYKYGKSINSYKKRNESESNLDVAERNGLLQPIFDIISDMIVKWRENQK